MSKYQNKYRIETTRISGYDYSQPGSYFITICTIDKLQIFGEIIDGKSILNAVGNTAKKCWLEIPKHYPNVAIDEFIIMPNHIHDIIIIKDNLVSYNKPAVETQNLESNKQQTVETQNLVSYNKPAVETQNLVSYNKPAVETQNLVSLQRQNINKFHNIIPLSIGSIIRGFKIGVTKWFRSNTDKQDVWQPNYYDHIIQNEQELYQIRQYINNNPLNCDIDENYHK